MEFFAIIFNKDETQLFQEIFFRKFLSFDLKVFIFVGVSMFLAVMEENFFFEENRQVVILEDGIYTVVFLDDQTSTWVMLLRVANNIISVFLDYWLFKRKFLYHQFLKASFLVEMDKQFIKSALIMELSIEVLAIHIQSYPQLNSNYRSTSLSRTSSYYYDTTLTAIFIMIRTLFFLRSLLYRSIFSSAKAFKICFNNGAHSGLLFTIKSEFQYSTQRFVIFFVCLYILIFGFLVRLCERSFEQLTSYDWDYVWNSFWIIIVDMTSVGYGDLTPVTNFGRVIIGIAAIGGGVITSLIYIIFLQNTSFDAKESKAYDRIKVYESQQELKARAQKCVGLSLKFNSRRRKAKSGIGSEGFPNAYDHFLVDIQNYVKDFSTLRKTIIDHTYKRKITEVIEFLKNKLNSDFDYVIDCISIIDFFEKKLEIINKNVDILSECVSNFEDLYSQTLVSVQYLNQKVMDIFAVPLESKLIKEFEGNESNFLLVDFINMAKSSLDVMRQSISLVTSGPERQGKRTVDEKTLQRLKKNKLITLKKLNKIEHSRFGTLENHEFAKKNHSLDGTGQEIFKENLILSNEAKAKNLVELSHVNGCRNSKLEGQRQSLAYRISVISEPRVNLTDSQNSINSEKSTNSVSFAKHFTIKRIERRELTSLAEEEGVNTLRSDSSSEGEEMTEQNLHQKGSPDKDEGINNGVVDNPSEKLRRLEELIDQNLVFLKNCKEVKEMKDFGEILLITEENRDEHAGLKEEENCGGVL